MKIVRFLKDSMFLILLLFVIIVVFDKPKDKVKQNDDKGEYSDTLKKDSVNKNH